MRHILNLDIIINGNELEKFLHDEGQVELVGRMAKDGLFMGFNMMKSYNDMMNYIIMFLTLNPDKISILPAYLKFFKMVDNQLYPMNDKETIDLLQRLKDRVEYFKNKYNL